MQIIRLNRVAMGKPEIEKIFSKEDYLSAFVGLKV